MAHVAVVTDSTCSLRADQARQAEVVVVPLQVVIDGESGPELSDGSTAAAVSEAMRQGKAVSTSRPAPEVFRSVYAELAVAGHDHIVSAHLSQKMSGTYEAASLAAQSAPVPVTVVDTRTLAMAAGFAVLSGAQLAAAGGTGEEVAAAIERRAAGGSTFFYVPTLEYLRRGGRIGAASALLGSALAMKPLLTIAEGQVRPHERVRTASKALARLEQLGLMALARGAGSSEHVDVAVHHLNDPVPAQQLADRLGTRLPASTDVEVCQVSAVLGVHVGPGMLGVVVSPRL
jgi:DegV family protein with EDD domain